ncbi:MAG: ferrochelatase [Propionibacteriaceae bacterium]
MTDLDPYDAVLLVSFGGPEQPDDVLPFLQNVTRGRGIPDERLAEVGEHYFLFGGRSPINEQCRTLLAALRADLSGRGIDLPIYWGNRNWDPYLPDAVAEIRRAGHRRVLAVVTSAYPSYSSCRQYRENLYDAVATTAPAAPATDPLVVDRLRHYAHHPGFVAAAVDATVAALDELGPVVEPARLVFVTHSIPTAMAQGSGLFVDPDSEHPDGYVVWHESVAAEVTRQVQSRTGGAHGHELVYCSRSGPPTQPWLEPDVNDRLRELAAAASSGVVVVPIGFISDHMEVVFDLDTEAAATATEVALPFARAATAGVHPAFVGGLVDLMLERAAVERAARDATPEPARPAVGGLPPAPERCLVGCCPNLRQPDRPALCGQPG